jgi:hypothetical protein
VRSSVSAGRSRALCAELSPVFVNEVTPSHILDLCPFGDRMRTRPVGTHDPRCGLTPNVICVRPASSPPNPGVRQHADHSNTPVRADGQQIQVGYGRDRARKGPPDRFDPRATPTVRTTSGMRTTRAARRFGEHRLPGQRRRRRDDNVRTPRHTARPRPRRGLRSLRSSRARMSAGLS